MFVGKDGTFVETQCAMYISNWWAGERLEDLTLESTDWDMIDDLRDQSICHLIGLQSTWHQTNSAPRHLGPSQLGPQKNSAQDISALVNSAPNRN